MAATRRAGLGVAASAPPALPSNFPRRNRLISGLALGVLVVEAARPERLADHRAAAPPSRAARCSRSPARSTTRWRSGCHALIRQGAKLVETARDILEELGSPCAAGAGEPWRRPRRQPALPRAGRRLPAAAGGDR
ncbi:MAG: DNA-processing protein DprA [Chromatiales bacterium]|nr:DNA-processing protein DprA [Chromatiales bacterium]